MGFSDWSKQPDIRPSIHAPIHASNLSYHARVQMCGIIIKTNTTLTKIRTINVAPAAIDGRSVVWLMWRTTTLSKMMKMRETLKDNSNYTAARQAIDDDDAEGEIIRFDSIRLELNWVTTSTTSSGGNGQPTNHSLPFHPSVCEFYSMRVLNCVNCKHLVGFWGHSE